MSSYEFSLRQEVLLEKGASVLGDFFRYCRAHKDVKPGDPIEVMHALVWNAKQNILAAQTETDLEQINGQFELAKNFIAKIEVGANA